MRGGGHLPPINLVAAPTLTLREGCGGDGAGVDASAGGSSLDRKVTLSREGSSEAAELSDGSRQSALDRTNPGQEQPTLQKMGTGDSAGSPWPGGGAEPEGILGRPVVSKQRRMSRIGRTSSEVPAPAAKEAGVAGGGRRRPSQYLGMGSNDASSLSGGDRRNLRDNIGKMSALAVAKLRGGDQDAVSSRRSIVPRSGLAHRRYV